MLMIDGGRKIKSQKGTPIIIGPAEALTLTDTLTSIYMELHTTMLRMMIITGVTGMLMRKIRATAGRLILGGSQSLGVILTILGITAILIGPEILGVVEIDIPGINMKAQGTEAKIRIIGTVIEIRIKPRKHEMKGEIVAGALLITGMIADPLTRNQEHMVEILL